MKTSTRIISIAISLASMAVSQSAFADTLARSFPLSKQIMITVYKPRLGGSDADGQLLWKSMNVPVQGSVMGPGKSIENPSKTFSWVCGDRGADGIQCTVMVQKGADTDIHSSPLGAKFEVIGTAAAALFQLVNPNTPKGDFSFQNAEGTLMIDATANHFLMQYQE